MKKQQVRGDLAAFPRAPATCFFERFKNRDQAALQGKVEDRETAVAEIEALVRRPTTPATRRCPADLYAHVQAARARWLQGPELPRHVLTAAGRSRQRGDAGAGHPLAGGLARAPTWIRRRPRARWRSCAQGGGAAAAESASRRRSCRRPRLLARQWREALAANTMGGGRRAAGRGSPPAGGRTGGAERPVGVGAPRPARSRAAQAAAGALRSRGRGSSSRGSGGQRRGRRGRRRVRVRSSRRGFKGREFKVSWNAARAPRCQTAAPSLSFVHEPLSFERRTP